MNFWRFVSTTNRNFKYLEGTVGTIKPYLTAIKYESRDKWLTTSSIEKVKDEGNFRTYITLNSAYVFENMGESVSMEDYLR